MPRQRESADRVPAGKMKADLFNLSSVAAPDSARQAWRRQITGRAILRHTLAILYTNWRAY